MTRALATMLALVLLAGVGRAAEPEPTPAPPDRAELPCVPLPPRQKVLLDLDDVPLRDVARFVACAAEIDLLFAPTSLGDKRVTVISAHPVDRRGLLALWQALLAEHRLVSERRGAYRVIRPERPSPR